MEIITFFFKSPHMMSASGTARAAVADSIMRCAQSVQQALLNSIRTFPKKSMARGLQLFKLVLARQHMGSDRPDVRQA
jgi:hypothetical protein